MHSLNELEALTAARELLSDRMKWTQGSSARDAAGFPVGAAHRRATCFCMIGAIEKVTGGHLVGSSEYAARAVLESVLQCGDIATFNDTPRRRHSEVLKAFDRAIAKAENQRVPA